MNTAKQVALLVVLWATGASGASTVNLTNRCAYAANAGWIDARADTATGAVIGRHVCSNYLYCANLGWVHLGDGTPDNGVAYGNASASDYGVNVDAQGRMSGCAWGANVGWLSFEQTCGRPRVDLRTGGLGGCVWSPNMGWISLSNAHAFVAVDALAVGPDADGDGLPDPWEYGYTNSLVGLGPASADADRDGASDTDEFGAGTDPTDPDDRLAITALSATNAVAPVLSWTAKDTRFYRIDVATSLVSAAWHDSALGLIVDPTTPTTTRTLSGAPTNQVFLRVKAVLPLAP